MARVTVQDCLEKMPNRFALVHLTSKRAIQLSRDAEPLVEPGSNKEIVVALREVASGRITTDETVEDVLSGQIHRKERKRARRRPRRSW
jgi:DNA-directed RNA polymerase subunit omega